VVKGSGRSDEVSQRNHRLISIEGVASEKQGSFFVEDTRLLGDKMVEGNARARREQREDWEEMERNLREDAGKNNCFIFFDGTFHGYP